MRGAVCAILLQAVGRYEQVEDLATCWMADNTWRFLMIALDLFCGAGGAAMGIHRTGIFDTIIGVDIEPQPDYPFEFVHADALDWSFKTLIPDFIWASPPCQAFTSVRGLSGADLPDLPDLIAPTRELLEFHPWTCIENVNEAPLRPDITLEGGNVGIPFLKRRRKFEVSWETGLHSPTQTIKPILFKIWGNWQSGSYKYVKRMKAQREARRMRSVPLPDEVGRGLGC